MKTASETGACGFIGSKLVKSLKKDGFWVRGVDLIFPEFSTTEAGDFCIGDLRNQKFTNFIVDQRFDKVNQLSEMIINISSKDLTIDNILGTLDFRWRNFDNGLISSKLNCEPAQSLKEGITKTYDWIKDQVLKSNK